MKSLHRTCFSSSRKLSGEPEMGNPYIRFDEGWRIDGHWHFRLSIRRPLPTLLKISNHMKHHFTPSIRLRMLTFFFIFQQYSLFPSEYFKNIEATPYLSIIQNKKFSDIPSFITELQELHKPWCKIFEGIQEDKSNGGYILEPYAPSELVKIQKLVSSSRLAVVLAVAERPRVSFCAVLFLLQKDGDSFKITDLIRRNDMGYSYFEKAEILPLAPNELTHIHLSYGRGDQKNMSNYDEFYVIQNSAFRRTLSLLTGYLIMRGPPQDDFSQFTKCGIKSDSLKMTVTRIWMKQDKENLSEKIDILFKWDPKNSRFTNPDMDKVFPTEPQILNQEKNSE